MMSVESKQMRDGDEVRRWLEAGQTQLASLLELLHEHDRLRERWRPPSAENERLRGVTYENEQLRNRLETSERQAEHLRQSMSELRGENERHQKERETRRNGSTTWSTRSRNGCARAAGHRAPEPATGAVDARRLRPVRVATPIFVRSLARGARQGAGMRASSAVLRAGFPLALALHPSPGWWPAQNFLYERTVIETEEKPRVLLVDDEEGVRMSLRALLDRESTGSRAWRAAKRRSRSCRASGPTWCSST